MLVHCSGPLVQKWCDQKICVHIDGKLLSAWLQADDFSGSWGRLETARMLSDPSAEPKGLCLSFCTEMVKCSWMGIGIDDLAPVYLARNHVTRVNCVLGSMLTSEDVALVTPQHRTALVWSQFWNVMDHLRSRDSPMDARLAGITPPGGHRDILQGS